MIQCSFTEELNRPDGSFTSSVCVQRAEILIVNDPCFGLCYACAYNKMKAENEKLKEKYQEYTTGKAKYYHDVWCNVSRDEPMGCEGCSCTIGKKIKDLKAENATLKEQKKRLMVALGQVLKG